MMLPDRAINQPFWDAYAAQAEAFRAFDPELVFVFGADHYSGQHMRLMPSFAIGHSAEAIADDGGFPGKLDVPLDLSLACARHLIEAEIDIATSYAMEVDHGFSAVIGHFTGAIGARPVIPVFVNALAAPRPTFRRCRMLGEAIGEFASRLGKRVAFLGSGGLSHETGDVFPQYLEAADQRTRDYLLHGGTRGDLTRDKWLAEMHGGLQFVNKMLPNGCRASVKFANRDKSSCACSPPASHRVDAGTMPTCCAKAAMVPAKCGRDRCRGPAQKAGPGRSVWTFTGKDCDGRASVVRARLSNAEAVPPLSCSMAAAVRRTRSCAAAGRSLRGARRARAAAAGTWPQRCIARCCRLLRSWGRVAKSAPSCDWWAFARAKLSLDTHTLPRASARMVRRDRRQRLRARAIGEAAGEPLEHGLDDSTPPPVMAFLEAGTRRSTIRCA